MALAGRPRKKTRKYPSMTKAASDEIEDFEKKLGIVDSKSPKKPGNRSQKRIQSDEEKIYDLAKIGCTQEEMASILKINIDTITDRHSEIVKEGYAHMNMSLRRKQFLVASQGNATLLMFLGKNRLNQNDSKHITFNQDNNLSEDQIQKKLRILMNELGIVDKASIIEPSKPVDSTTPDSTTTTTTN